MSCDYLEVPPGRTDVRKLSRAAARFPAGSFSVLPTDTNYVFACLLGDSEAIGKLQSARVDKTDSLPTLMISDFKVLGTYAVVDNAHFKLLKSLVPGPYTFILPATKKVPKAFAHPKRKTIGIRVPANDILRSFLQCLEKPLLTKSLKTPNSDAALANLHEDLDWLKKVAALILDAGELDGGETTILDLSSSDSVKVVREGRGPVDFEHE